jgi:hypothetical protein
MNSKLESVFAEDPPAVVLGKFRHPDPGGK